MIQELINRAGKQGHVTFDDVVEVLEDDGETDISGLLENVLYELSELGITLQKEPLEDVGPARAAQGPGEEQGPGEDMEAELSQHPEIMEDPNIGDIGAISSDDPVGLYFRQMAQEPLLSADEEVRLAKRIERGKLAEKRLNKLSPERSQIGRAHV